ncbi:MAG: hypothetical protein U0234_03900 [Sandaracinus sp.]
MRRLGASMGIALLASLATTSASAQPSDRAGSERAHCVAIARAAITAAEQAWGEVERRHPVVPDDASAHAELRLARTALEALIARYDALFRCADPAASVEAEVRAARALSRYAALLRRYAPVDAMLAAGAAAVECDALGREVVAVRIARSTRVTSDFAVSAWGMLDRTPRPAVDRCGARAGITVEDADFVPPR